MAKTRFVGLVLVALAIALPSPARAVNTCNSLFTIDYVPPGPQYAQTGDTLHVRLTLGAGSVQGGTAVTYHRVRFNLDCNSTFPLVLPCTDEGAIVQYQGDGTISTECGVGW